jgi:membrane-bound lytic murein transglycosylase B
MGTIFIEGKDRKITKRKDGYEVYSLNRKIKYVHRFIAEKHIPNPENKPCVNHINGIKWDNRVENLEWTTYYENNKHARSNGLWGQNIVNKRKLNPEMIEEAKQKYKSGKLSYNKIASQYGVDYKTIYDAINNKSYKKK